MNSISTLESVQALGLALAVLLLVVAVLSLAVLVSTSSVTVTRVKKLKWALLAVFLPHRYWRLRSKEELTDAIDPEFGWIWRETEDGGRAINAARDEGYRLGWQAAINHVPDSHSGPCKEMR